jgi:3-oxoacyl-[acyl-carrier protein] reductase
MAAGVEGRVAVITGSARNIGKACAVELARQGAKVVINARSKDKVDQTVDEIKTMGGQAYPSYQSVATDEGCRGVIADAVRGFGTVDILVNNAAIVTFHYIHEMPDDEWGAVINTNLTAYFRTTKAALPIMMDKKWGRIINMSSHAGLTGTTLRSHYAAAKGGIHAFTKATAKEYGKFNITANAIAPFVGKDEIEDNPVQYGALYRPQPAEFAAQNTAVSEGAMAVGGGRRSDPSTVAPMCAFFASEEAWYITGQIISVGGGRWMG